FIAFIGYQHRDCGMPGIVRVAVRGDVHTAPPGFLNQAHRFGRLAPHADRAQLDVRNLDRDARLLADSNGFAQRLEAAVGLIPDVGHVEATESRRHAGQSDEFFRCAVAADLVLEDNKTYTLALSAFLLAGGRSEERRVGKEWRAGWGAG